MTNQNNFILKILNARLAELEEEKNVIEEHKNKLLGFIGTRKPAILTLKEPLRSDGAGNVIFDKPQTFRDYLKANKIKLRKADKRYSMYYQRYKAEKKKNG